jgi:hypothetical protein
MTNSTLEVFGDTGADRERWLEMWALCGREPFAHPDYIRLMGSPGDQPHLLVAHCAAGIEILPLVLRPLTDLSWTGGTDLCDAASPYGYGGPYSSGAPVYGTWRGLAEWFNQHQVVAWFGRLALGSPVEADPSALSKPSTDSVPFGVNSAGSTTVRCDADNVIVALKYSEAEQWRRYAPKVRKNVNKAVRAGLRVEVAPHFSDLKEFTSLYAATMERRAAAAWYRFDVAFFTALTIALSGRYLAAEVRDRTGRLVSAELVLMSDRRAYSFLGGTYPDAFPDAPNDLLKHAVINHAREIGCVEYVLGGGSRPEDGIFRYKRAFDHGGVLPFHRVQMVVDNQAYQRLTQMRSQFERILTPDAQLQGDYFPTYRAGRIPAPEGKDHLVTPGAR